MKVFITGATGFIGGSVANERYSGFGKRGDRMSCTKRRIDPAAANCDAE
jgi:hypothetical protein